MGAKLSHSFFIATIILFPFPEVRQTVFLQYVLETSVDEFSYFLFSFCDFGVKFF